MTDMQTITEEFGLQAADIERFWQQVDKRGPDDCWLWTGRSHTGGVGALKTKTKLWTVQIVAWILEYGQYPYQKHVHATCGNKKCCNVAHLREKERRDDWQYFLSMIEHRGECWVWQGETSESHLGGSVHLSDGRCIKPHKYAWEHERGEKLGRDIIRRGCETPGCVNPDHWHKGFGREDIERFWSKVKENPETGCMEWQGSTRDGYGRFHCQYKLWNAHRFAWELANGPIPDDMQVLHHCDNRLCVNVEHLFTGTCQDNMDDMYAKGRDRKNPATGEDVWCSVLTEEDVKDILSLLKTYKQTSIAKMYGVDHSVISNIKTGKAWKHVPRE